MYTVSQFLNAGASQIDKVTNTGKSFSEALRGFSVTRFDYTGA